MSDGDEFRVKLEYDHDRRHVRVRAAHGDIHLGWFHSVRGRRQDEAEDHHLFYIFRPEGSYWTPPMLRAVADALEHVNRETGR